MPHDVERSFEVPSIMRTRDLSGEGMSQHADDAPTRTRRALLPIAIWTLYRLDIHKLRHEMVRSS